jgi:hypothetical protein
MQDFECLCGKVRRDNYFAEDFRYCYGALFIKDFIDRYNTAKWRLFICCVSLIPSFF